MVDGAQAMGEGVREVPWDTEGGETQHREDVSSSVLGDLAVVFRMNVPAQTDGQEQPQQLQRTGQSQDGWPRSQNPTTQLNTGL